MISDAISRGKLPLVDDWDRIVIQPPQSLTVDAGRDANAEREDMKAGLLTFRDHYGKRGLDWQQEIEQGATEIEFLIAKAKEIAESSDVPLATVLNRLSLLTPNGEAVTNLADDE